MVYRYRRVRAPILFAAVIYWFGTHPGFAREITLEERVRAQREIERVMWSHRTWPKENPSSRPSLATLMPDTSIRANVVDALLKSNALAAWWRRPIDGAQLQAELDRMARDSRDPGVLREIFNALGRDPRLIAETLGRQVLVDRLIHQLYETNARIHAPVRKKASSELLTCAGPECLTLAEQTQETTWVRMTSQTKAREPEFGRDSAIGLDAEEWNEQIAQLRDIFGSSAGPLPLRIQSPLHETSEAFFVTSVLEQSPNTIRTLTRSWIKEPFEAWWNRNRARFRAAVPSDERFYSLPDLTSTGCDLDRWTPPAVPEARMGHTAVWTGTEMIVWGGYETWVGPSRSSGGRYNPATDSWSRVSHGANLPKARANHSAVWTGTEMIVWGGLSGMNNPENTGGRYDPAADAWVATSTGMNVPAARANHVAFWTGSRMIVWGGSTGASYLNTGGLYDPQTDSWTPTSTGAGVPDPRVGPSAVWTGTEMIVWGGKTPGNVVLNTGSRYAPATDSWTTIPVTASTPDARSGAATVWTGSEMIVWGGDRGGQFGGRFSPSTGTWRPTSTGTNCPQRRTTSTTVWTGSEMVVWGGGTGASYLNTGGRYRPATDSWLTTSTGVNVPTARENHSAIWTGSRMIVWGGNTGGSTGLSTGGSYDPIADGWTPTYAAAPPQGRHWHSAVWTGVEMIVWGGNNGSIDFNTGGRYTPATDSWVPTSTGANVPTPRRNHKSLWTGSEMIVWGGVAGSANPAFPIVGGLYDPGLDTWRPTSTVSAPPGRTSFTAIWTGRRMVVWGGSNYNGLQPSGSYDPAKDTWTPVSQMGQPEPRWGDAAVWTGREMLVWGGVTQYVPGTDTYLATGGRYDPSSDTWNAITTTGAPSARRSEAAVWTGRKMIVWGGYGDDFVTLNTGGRYDPATDTWTPTSAMETVPSAVRGCSSIWTGTELILWGGYSLSLGTLKTGYRYDPALDTWTFLPSSSDGPSARIDPTAVWTGSEMIVWGGYVPNNQYQTTTGAFCVASCASPTVYYQDHDGDGHGDADVSVPACVAPAEYTGSGDDCDDGAASIHPGAPEINDGLDNQCPGEPGYGVADEVSGTTGFIDPVDKTLFSWEVQSGATAYAVARSTAPDFSVDCTLFATSEPSVVDMAEPLTGGAFFYLVRPMAAFQGSWGQRSDGTERTTSCP